jgi:hypothetical protein
MIATTTRTATTIRGVPIVVFGILGKLPNRRQTTVTSHNTGTKLPTAMIGPVRKVVKIDSAGSVVIFQLHPETYVPYLIVGSSQGVVLLVTGGGGGATLAIGITVVNGQVVVIEYFATIATITVVIVKTVFAVITAPLDRIGRIPTFGVTAMATLNIGFIETSLTIGASPNFLTIVLLDPLGTFVAGEPAVILGTIDTAIKLAIDQFTLGKGDRFATLATLH